MKNLLVFCLGLLALAVPALAKTPDGKPPSEETVCDGLDGALFGLCNAYCEAMDCDSPAPHASPTACARVLGNFMKHSGGQPPPCEASEVTCPCGAALPLFNSVESNSATLRQCIIDTVSQVIVVLTSEGTFAVVSLAAEHPYCSANLEQFLQIAPQEIAACRERLMHAATQQGVECVSPE